MVFRNQTRQNMVVLKSNNPKYYRTALNSPYFSLPNSNVAKMLQKAFQSLESFNRQIKELHKVNFKD